jgi:hypothetical protein
VVVIASVRGRVDDTRGGPRVWEMEGVVKGNLAVEERV